MKSIEQEAARIYERERRSNFLAEASELTWRVDIQTRLQALAKTLTACPTERHTFSSSATNSEWNKLPGFEIVASSETLYSSSSLPFANGTSVTFEQEEPASLRYEMHPDGSIAVILKPHSSPLRGLNESVLVIDYARSSNEFAGDCGNRRLSRHISALLFVCDASHSMSCPSPATGRHLRKIQRKSDKYRDLYQGSCTQKRKAERDADIALGTGLAGGLVASTLLPLARDAGNNAQQRLVNQHCDGPHYAETRCNANAYIVRDHSISSVFTTESVLFAGILIFLSVLVFIRRMFK
ncbi:hypothetical protein ABH945_003764 [Paraburkholderia sp. GAS333]|uniref:hypothetical protein n=1 Tax=Paraburkholderia sp. GAS333 TaxID=3156279 RepID=UPI003D21E92C